MQEVIIIGTGPAGISAGIFCGMYKLKTLVIGEVLGGQLSLAPMIIDYPGSEPTSGKDWISRSLKQLKNSGVQLIQDKITKISISKPNHTFEVVSQAGGSFSSNCLIFATGNEKRRISYSGSKLAETLGIEVSHENFIITNELLATNLPGVFAAGNCLKYPKSLEQLANASSQGILAASQAYEYLKNQSAPILWGTTSIKNPY